MRSLADKRRGRAQSHILQRCRQQLRPGHIRRSGVFNPGQQRSSRSRGLTAAVGSGAFAERDVQRCRLWAEVFGGLVCRISRAWEFPHTCGELLSPWEGAFTVALCKFLPWFSLELVSSIYFLYHGSGSRIKAKAATPLMLLIKRPTSRWLEFMVVIQSWDVSIKPQMQRWVKSEARVCKCSSKFATSYKNDVAWDVCII